MNWAEVKKINSDMSTTLDVLIKGQRTLGSSDNIIAIISDEYHGAGYGYKKSFIPKVSGVVRILLHHTYSNFIGTLIVYEDGKKIKEYSIPTATGEYSFDISVSKEKKYSFENGGGTGVDSIKIGAQIIDGSLFKVVDTE